MEHSSFLTVALDAVKKAEEAIMRHYKRGVTAELKDDNSPVTVADTEAEKIIIDTIKTAFPDHGVYGEDSGETKSGSGYVWVIDPIDGTKNFIKRRPYFGTLLALMKNDEIILGVSSVPLMNEVAYAVKGKGAFINWKRVYVSDAPSISDASLAYTGLRDILSSAIKDPFIELATKSWQNIGSCDLYTYHLLARGSVEICVEGNIRLWDIAAGKILVEEAGGRMTDLNGNPITKETRQCVATNGKLHDEILRRLKR